MNLHTSSSHYPIERINNNDRDQHYQLPFALISTSTHQVVSSSSSSSPSSQLFFTSSTHHQDDHSTGYYHHHQLYNQPHFQDQDTLKYATYNNRGGSSYEIKNKVDNGLKLTLWKKEDEEASADQIKAADNNPVKWMSSKIRLMKRMKNSTNFVARKPKIDDSTEDQKLQPFSSPSLESSDHLSSNSSSYNNNNSTYPIRVCSDCNTTKTPLWRSGPNGPKSLCNACGIRQRKARRAMAAAAAAAASGAVVAGDQQPPTTVLKIKVQHKEKMSMKNGNSPQIKKRCRTAYSTITTTAAAGSSDSGGGGGGGGEKKIGFEEFLINLSNNLSVHRVLPDEEKDAAILLMALSSGLVHG